MNKIAVYEALLEDHPLWNKEAMLDDSDRKALLAGGVATLGTLGGAYAAYRIRRPGMQRQRQRLVDAARRTGRTKERLVEKYKSTGMSAGEANRMADRVARGKK